MKIIFKLDSERDWRMLPGLKRAAKLPDGTAWANYLFGTALTATPNIVHVMVSACIEQHSE